MTKLSEINIVDRAPAAGKALTSIRDSIVMQHFRHGDMLIEAVLAEDIKVSRGSIRTAFQALEKEGLISTLPNGRKTVVGIDEKFIVDLYETRTLLEKAAARTCMGNTNIDFSRIAMALPLFYTLQTAEENIIFQKRAEANTLFHRAFFEAADNRSLLQCWETIEPILFSLAKFNYVTLGSQTDDDVLVQTHTTLLEMLLKKDKSILSEIQAHNEVAKIESLEGLEKRLKEI